MKLPSSWALAFGLTLVLAVSSRSALAETKSIWIDVRPWTCARESAAFAREVELACDASGGHCHVSPSRAEATEHAVLLCESANRWVLRAQSPDGAVLYAVTLEGDREERLRKAAMWTTRTLDGVEDHLGVHSEPPPVAPAQAPALRSPPVDARVDADEPETKHEERAMKTKRTGGVALDATIGVTNSDVAQSFHGLHARIADSVGPLHLGISGGWSQLFESADNSSVSGNGSSSTSGSSYNGRYVADVKTVGATLGWGAPFTDGIVGAWAEVGMAWGDWHGGAQTADLTPAPASSFMTPYGRAEVILQLPLRGPVRPYAYAAGQHAFDQFGEGVQSASIGAGLVWQAW